MHEPTLHRIFLTLQATRRYVGEVAKEHDLLVNEQIAPLRLVAKNKRLWPSGWNDDTLDEVEYLVTHADGSLEVLKQQFGKAEKNYTNMMGAYKQEQLLLALGANQLVMLNGTTIDDYVQNEQTEFALRLEEIGKAGSLYANDLSRLKKHF